MKLLDKNIGENLWELRLGRAYLSLIPKAQFITGKIDKLDFIKIKTFVLGKHLGIKDKIQTWINICKPHKRKRTST